MTYRTFIAVLICGILYNGSCTQKKQDQVLMVVSSYGKDAGEKRPGYSFDEFSQAYLVFKSNQLNVTVASPRGGAVESDEFNGEKPYNKAVLQDDEAMDKLAKTLPTAAIGANKFDAIFVVGGKGAVFDLSHDPALQDLIAATYQTGRVVSAVGQGAAALVHVTLDNGEYLVDDKAVSGFTNDEEVLFGKSWATAYPFLLEDKLIERGAVLERSDMMFPQISTAGKLISGQNLYSTLATAEAVIQFLGKQPVERNPYPDERSMALLKQMVITGQKERAATTLRSDTSLFDVDLIAVYGHYRLLHAKDDQKIRLAMDIIELATPYVYNPALQLTRAEGYLRLGDQETAKQLLTDLLVKEPDLEEAKELLETL